MDWFFNSSVLSDVLNIYMAKTYHCLIIPATAIIDDAVESLIYSDAEGFKTLDILYVLSRPWKNAAPLHPKGTTCGAYMERST